ncbi:hypothetical protein B0H10DRAFT_2002970, partial [Mycena sp. CBHHK59/15]
MQPYFIVSSLYLLLLAFHVADAVARAFGLGHPQEQCLAMLECTTIMAYTSRTCAIATIMLSYASLGSWKVQHHSVCTL